MKLKILASAIADIHTGKDFYEKQAAGLVEYFLDSISTDIDSLLLYAGVHQKFQCYYRILAKRFPYAIYYTTEGDVTLVWRILDLRQNPKKTRRQLKGF
jgi:plasmid stabilization system protein ParE